MRSPRPQGLMGTTPPSWPLQLQCPARTAGPTKPRVSELSSSLLAQHSPPASQKIPTRGWIATVAWSMAQSPSMAVLAGERQRRSLLAGLRGYQVMGGLRRAKSGEGEIPPPLPHLHPPLHYHLPRIWAWREYPPPALSPPLGRHPRLIPFASLPAIVRYGHSWWPPISSHPQVR
jgi:hypothetical protein